MYNFNYNKLIAIYKSYFNKVVVIKHEKFGNFSLINKIFNFDEDFIFLLNNTYKKKVRNKSISSLGLKVLLFLSKFINLKRYDLFIRRFDYTLKKDTFFSRTRIKILKNLQIQHFFQYKFDKIIPYKKYYIKKKFIPIDIDRLIEDYDKMEDIYIFNK